MDSLTLRQAHNQISPQRERNALPSLDHLLACGGDSRIVIDANTGVNTYGCRPHPDPELISLGSSTASVISPIAYATAQQCWQRLQQSARAGESQATTYARELYHLRNQLVHLCGIADIPGLEVIFGASGTDLHLIAGRLMEGTTQSPSLGIFMDAVETGRSVPAALAGRHFSHCTSLGEKVERGEDIATGGSIELTAVSLRKNGGTPRPLADIDAEITLLVESAASQGRRVLLTMVDVSKTGMIAPSPECALALKQKWPDQVDVLIDACQFRLSPETLRAYLTHGFMLALTGSKFVTGPSSAGALLLPAAIARRLKGRLLPRALAAYSSRVEWPQHWTGAGLLNNTPNYGLLLRWQAALEELRAFRRLSDPAISGFLCRFGQVITTRLQADPIFESIPVPPINRNAFSLRQNWDQLQTIFPFLLHRRTGFGAAIPLSSEETLQVYERLQQDLTASHAESSNITSDELAAMRFQLGQPVYCGESDSVPVSALRICVSARMIVRALSDGGANTPRVMAEALQALDKAAALID